MEIVSKERIHLLLDTRRLYCATFSSTLSFKLHDIFPWRVQKSKISSHSKLCRRLFDSQKTHAPFFFHAFFVHSARKPLRNHEDGGISGEFQQRQLTEALRRVYLVRDKGYKIRWWRGEDDSRCVVEDATSSSARNLVGTSHRLASPRLSFLTSFRRTLHHQSPPYPTAFTGNEKRRYPDGRFNFPARVYSTDLSLDHEADKERSRCRSICSNTSPRWSFYHFHSQLMIPPPVQRERWTRFAEFLRERREISNRIS